MKKRTKLMLGLSAMLLAAGGVAATGTFAWFKATTATDIDTYTAQTGSISTKGGTYNLGHFTVKAIPQAEIAAVELTTTAGKSYIFTGGTVGNAGTGKTEVTVTDGVRTVDCKLQVIYVSASGEAAKTAGEIATIWADTIGNKAIGIKATSDEKVRFLDSASPANESAWAGTAGTTGVTYSVSNANLLGLAFNACTGNGASATSMTNADAASDWFVAITGDDTNVEAAAAHSLTFTPQTAA